MPQYLAFFGISFALALILTPIIRKLALKSGQVAVPRENRWHRKETALLGGIGIFSAMMITWFLGSLWGGWTTFGQPYLPFVLCASGIFLLGLADDIFNMAPQHKLAGQVIITAILLFFGFRLGWTDSKTLDLFLSILWIVGITNAFNLLDNMDGLSCGIAFIAGAFLFAYHYLHPSPDHFSGPGLFLLCTYLGSILGFLVYNFNPASIFMGDAGSLFIGFVLACLAMAGKTSPASGESSFFHLLSVILIPVLILFIPILDTGFVSLMRKLFRRPISQGGRDHSSHRLVAIGFTEKKAVLVLYAFSVASGLLALAIYRLNTGTSAVLTILYLLFILFFWIYLAKVKVYSEKSIVDHPTGTMTPLLIEMTYHRRLFEVLLDLLLITIAYYTAYLLRFEGVPGPNFDFFLKSLPIVIACQILFFFLFGVYRGVWDNTSLRDLISYGKAITAGTIAPILLLLFLYRFYSFSRAVFVIYWGLMLMLVSLTRLSFRLLDEGVRRGNQKGKPVLVYGAGLGGQILLKEIETNETLSLTIKGFIDDNREIQRKRVRGYPVLGGIKDLEKILLAHPVREIIISFRKNSSDKRREINRLLENMGAEVDVREMKLTID